MRLASIAGSAALAAVLAGLGGCGGSQDVVPETASSASSVQYATEWPGRMKTIRDRYAEGAKAARADIDALPSFPAALSDPDWAAVASVYDEADRAGRSEAVVELLLSSRRIEAFVEEREKGLSRRMGAHFAAMLKAQECECEVQAGPATGRALEDAVDRELEERYHELNEAHGLLDRHAELFSKQDLATLEGQVDRITATSFFVSVDAPMLRDEIDRLMEEVERIGETLDAAIASARAAADAPAASRAEKSSAEERLELLQAARGPLDAMADDTRVARDGLEERIVELRESYEAALATLREDVARRAEAGGASD